MYYKNRQSSDATQIITRTEESYLTKRLVEDDNDTNMYELAKKIEEKSKILLQHPAAFLTLLPALRVLLAA